MRRLILAALAPMFVLLQAGGQNKVYWVHGLGDGIPKEWEKKYSPGTIEYNKQWNTYKWALVDEDNRGESIQWYPENPLRAAADSLNDAIGKEVPPGSGAIVFGHSAGGLVARCAAGTNGRIRAVITAGTPNGGAGIVTALHDRSLNNVANTAVSKVESSLALGTAAICSAFPGISSGIVSLISGSIRLGGEVGRCLGLDFIEKKKGEYDTPAANDMDPDMSRNDFLRNLNASAPRVPIINLYGNEDEKRLVRLAGTASRKAKNDSPNNTTDECYDQALYPAYNAALGTSLAFEVLHYAAGATLAVIGIFCPYYFASSAMNFSAAAAWTGTHRFIQYDIHNEWDSIIGAVHTDRIENWHRFLWWRWCDVEYVTVYENSDGFIPNKSSIMDESKGPRTRNYEVLGVNHLEMNSHIEMRRMLREILKDGTYGEEFDYHL